MKYVYAITGYHDAWADVVGQQANLKLQQDLDTEPKILLLMMKLYDVTNYP